MLERLLCDNFPIEPGPFSRAPEPVKGGKRAKEANAIWMTINNALHKQIYEESMDKLV
jgi:hypothetical protein